MARDTDDIGMYVGCTACVALVTLNEIYVANAGDSRCVLARKNQAIEMSTDHKPELPTEKSRIEKAGGFVEENRVKGILNLSRSLGDLEYKSDKSLAPELQMITASPELKKEPINNQTDFVIIACDGIWDCLSSQEAVDFVYEQFNKHKSDKKYQISKCIETMFDKIIAEDVASSGNSLRPNFRRRHWVRQHDVRCFSVQKIKNPLLLTAKFILFR